MCFSPPEPERQLSQPVMAEEGAQALELGSESFNRGDTARSGLMLPGSGAAPAPSGGLRLPGSS